VEPKSTPQKIDFEGALHTRGAYFHTFHANGQIGHTCVGPQKLRWPRAPRSLNPSLGEMVQGQQNQGINMAWKLSRYESHRKFMGHPQT